MTVKISSSKLNKYLNCSESYRRHYIQKDPTIPSPNMLTGNLFDAMAEYANTSLKNNGKMPDIEVLKSVVETSFVLERQKAFVFKSRESDLTSSRNKLIEAKEKALALIPLFIENNSELKPLVIQELQEVHLTDLDIDLVLRMDILTEDGGIIDYKTGGKLKNQKDIDNDTGLTFYALSYYHSTGKLPKLIQFHNYVAYVTPKHKDVVTKFQILETHRTKDDFDILLAKCSEVLKAIDNNIFLPASPTSFMCSQDFCSYYKDCRYVNQKRLLEV